MPTGEAIRWGPLQPEPMSPNLWRVYPTHTSQGEAVAPNDFNRKSTGRFAAGAASPARAMFYAAGTPEAALWESPPLRDLIGTRVPLSIRQFTGKRLVQLRPTRTLLLLDLRVAKLRAQVLSIDALDQLRDHLVTDRHADTHDTAASLLAAAAAQDIPLDGVTWQSRQHGADAVYLLYAPPASSSVLTVIPGSEKVLDDPAVAWPCVDAALSQAGMVRVTADGDAGNRLAEDPP